MKIKMPVFVFTRWFFSHIWFSILPVSTKGVIGSSCPTSVMLIIVFWSLTHCLIHCGALVCDPVSGRDPSLLPLLTVSCQRGKPRCLLEGNAFAVRALQSLSALFPVIQGWMPRLVLRVSNDLLTWWDLNGRTVQHLEHVAEYSNKEERDCLRIGLAVLLETLDISRLVLSLKQWHYLDIHWSQTMREGDNRGTSVMVRGEACQHLKHKFAATSKLLLLTYFSCRDGHF